MRETAIIQPPVADMMPGQDFRRFGPYVLLRCSGAGGFGRIDLALKGLPDLAKLCVVKRMRKDDYGPEIEARFRREGQIALRLSHGAIAQTLGVEEIEGELCLLQEFVDGVNLRQLQSHCDPELVPVTVAIYVVREVARALAYAHSFGIVHRDVTPENVMLSFDGQVKLIDFGIARGTGDATLTHTGTVVGRESYTAPEVWAGGKADSRADIFSLGVVLWQLATGKNFQDVQNSRGEETTDPREFNASVSPQLADVVLRALATEPGDRFQSAWAMVEALGALLPIGLGTEPALAAVLSRYFNVERERKILADDIEAAKRLLADANNPRALPQHPRSAGLGVGKVAIGVVASLLGFAGITVAMRQSGRREAMADAPRPLVESGQLPGSPIPSSSTTAMPSSSKSGGPEATTREPPFMPASVIGRRRLDSAGHLGGRPGTLAVAADSGRRLLEQARERWDTDDVDGALVLAKRAAAFGAGGDAHVLIGTLLLKKEQRADAESEFEEALRIDPSNRKASRLLQLTRGASNDHD